MHEESKVSNNESVLTREINTWGITNLLNNEKSRIPRSSNKRSSEPLEEEKVPSSDPFLSFEMPVDMPGSEQRLEYLKQMEKQLFPSENKQPKRDKHRLKEYKRVRDAPSAPKTDLSHNFIGYRPIEDQAIIEKYLKEIRGEADTTVGFLPEQHVNRIRGLEEQDDARHPLLSDALAYDSDGNLASVIGAKDRSSRLSDDTYFCPNVDPAKELQNEILRNKKAKERLRMLEKQASLNRARQNAPLKKYYDTKNLR
jgi:hypothetical protein